MDPVALNVIAERKKANAKALKLKEKFTQDAVKTVKIKVAQDSLYWELKEKLSNTERNYESLQRNMVQLQMEHEADSARLRDELRLRMETLNKLECQRKISDMLDGNMERLRATLQRVSLDRTALADAYSRADAAVTAATGDSERRLLAAAQDARAATDRAKLCSEHVQQLKETVSVERARGAAAATDAARMRDQLARADTLLAERENNIKELRSELHRLTAELNEHRERTATVIADLHKEAGAASALRTALAQAEARGEDAAREAARVSGELASAAAARNDAEQQIQEAQSYIEKMKEGMAFMVEKCDALVKLIEAKDEKNCSLEKIIAESQQEVHMLSQRVENLSEERERERREFEEHSVEHERETNDLKERFNLTEREAIQRAETIEKLTLEVNDIKQAHERTLTQLDRERGDNEKRTAELERHLIESRDSVVRLQNELAVETEARSRADANLGEENKERERERQYFKERIDKARRELAERNDDIERLKRDLAAVSEARSLADEALAKQVAERHRERIDLEERNSVIERELNKYDETVAHLRRELAAESESRARADSDLSKTRAELNRACNEAAQALDDVRHLKADSRRKDDEVAKQMQIILSIRTEKEQMQDKINEMKETINNIQEITRKAPPAPAAGAPREPPEHDDNAVATPFRNISQTPSAKKRKNDDVNKPVFRSDEIFSLFSDNESTDGGFDQTETCRRFGAMARGVPLSSPLRQQKRRHETSRPRAPAPTQEPSSMAAPSPAPATAPPAPPARKFFKTRRLGSERNK